MLPNVQTLIVPERITLMMYIIMEQLCKHAKNVTNHVQLAIVDLLQDVCHVRIHNSIYNKINAKINAIVVIIQIVIMSVNLVILNAMLAMGHNTQNALFVHQDTNTYKLIHA